MKSFCAIVTVFTLGSLGWAATPLQLDKAKASRDAAGFNTEIAVKGDWDVNALDVSFLNEAVIIDVPRATLAHGKQLLRVDDPAIKSVFITQPKNDVARVRITLNKGFNAHSLEGALQLHHKDGVFAVLINADPEKGTGHKKEIEAIKTFNVTESEAEPIAGDEDTPKLVASGEVSSEANEPIFAKAAENVPTTVSVAPPEPKVDVNKASENEIPVLATAKIEKKSGSDSIKRLLLSFAVIVLVLAAVTFALKKWAKKTKGANQNTKIKILTQHHLGPKRSLVIVQVAGESLLLGVTDQSISMLKTLSLLDEEISEAVPKSFNAALENYAEEDEYAETTPRAQIQSRGHKKDNIDDFAMRGLSEIRDVVSTRLKNMRQL